jgi:hypothetical protein
VEAEGWEFLVCPLATINNFTWLENINSEINIIMCLRVIKEQRPGKAAVLIW